MPSYRLEVEDLDNLDQLIPDFISITSDLNDPRLKGASTHQLTTISFVYVSASMTGYKSIIAFGNFATFAWP